MSGNKLWRNASRLVRERWRDQYDEPHPSSSLDQEDIVLVIKGLEFGRQEAYEEQSKLMGQIQKATTYGTVACPGLKGSHHIAFLPKSLVKRIKAGTDEE